MTAFFATAVHNITHGTPLAAWRADSKPPKEDLMSNRSDIRALLTAGGKMRRADLLEAIRHIPNHTAAIQQMVKEGLVVRTDADGGTYYELGKAPGAARAKSTTHKPAAKPAAKKPAPKKTPAKKATNKPAAPEFKFTSATPTSMPSIGLLLDYLKARRANINAAIEALELFA